MLRSLEGGTGADGGGARRTAISDSEESWLVPSAEIYVKTQKNSDFLVWLLDGGWGEK